MTAESTPAEGLRSSDPPLGVQRPGAMKNQSMRPSTSMRRLSQYAAQSCEHATSPASTCRCRCGGALHGGQRVEAVASLPADDPHAPAMTCVALGAKGKKCGRKAVVIDDEHVGAVCRLHATGEARILVDSMPPPARRKQLDLFDHVDVRLRRGAS